MNLFYLICGLDRGGAVRENRAFSLHKPQKTVFGRSDQVLDTTSDSFVFQLVSSCLDQNRTL